MRYSRISIHTLPILVILVYSLNTVAIPGGTTTGVATPVVAAPAPEESDFQYLMIEGRKVYYNAALTRDYRRNIQQAIDKIAASGSPDLQGVDFAEMKKRSEQIFVTVADGKPFVGSGYRNGAVNFAKQGMIIFNLEKIRKNGHNQNILKSWHEALEAMGYNDNNYLASSVFSQKAADPQTPLHPRVAKRLIQQLNEPRIQINKTWKEADGGATGVGGGGDGDIAEIKGALLFVLQKLAVLGELGSPTDSDALIDVAIDTPIESIEFESKYRFISKVAKITVARSLITDELTVLVNPQDWPSLHLTNGTITNEHTRFLHHIELVIKTIAEVQRPNQR